MDEKPSTGQLAWGIMLALAGLGVFYRIPQVIPPLMEQYEYFSRISWFVYFCCYLLAVLLVIGGGRKIYGYYRASREKDEQGGDGEQ